MESHHSIGTSLLVEEMYRGTPVMYMDFTDYDEIAHHSGPERPESLDALDGIDRQIGILEKASQDAPRPYHFVLVADHGQCLGPTFLQRYGVSLEQLVHSLMGGPASVLAATSAVEAWGPLNVFLSEVSETDGLAGSVTRSATGDRRTDGHVDVGPPDQVFTPRDQAPHVSAGQTVTDRPGTASDEPAAEDRPDLVVAAGGNLAHVYFNAENARLSLERIEQLHPGLADALANHPGIGLLIMRSQERGLLCVGADGIHYLDEDKVTGADPLAIYGEHAVAAVRRIDQVEHVGDIMVISPYDPGTGEVVAYEELVGIHGGLGGVQTRPYILHPSEWELDLGRPLIGAPMVYQQLRRWMERELGMQLGQRAEARSAESSPTDVR